MRSLAPLVSCALAACTTASGAAPDLSVEAEGPRLVGTSHGTVTDDARGRTLDYQVWYPTPAEPSGVQIERLEDARRADYGTLLAGAPACPTRVTRLTIEAAKPDDGPFPVVLFSHCHECTRLSSASIAARLASHGFLVYAVEHAGNTLWDQLAGTGVPLNGEFLEVRAADVRFVLDRIAARDLPYSDLADTARVGMFGHSFGAVTTGRVAQLDARISAALALNAPFENPLIPGVTLAEIKVPVMFVVAQEDNSITELGNVLMRNNFRDAPVEAWKLEMPDAGHWSVSDLAGLVPAFAPGCGDGTRQTDGAPFTYLDPGLGRSIGASYVTAFFRTTLLQDAGTRAYLDAISPTTALVTEHHR
ncbi:MAG: dienelactone hydrolase family protein [Deltaproteobacteria bacterium]|nr:dienelactone hydrolase family protein [Deltaproteobacteria bacterium]